MLSKLLLIVPIIILTSVAVLDKCTLNVDSLFNIFESGNEDILLLEQLEFDFYTKLDSSFYFEPSVKFSDNGNQKCWVTLPTNQGYFGDFKAEVEFDLCKVFQIYDVSLDKVAEYNKKHFLSPSYNYDLVYKNLSNNKIRLRDFLGPTIAFPSIETIAYSDSGHSYYLGISADNKNSRYYLEILDSQNPNRFQPIESTLKNVIARKGLEKIALNLKETQIYAINNLLFTSSNSLLFADGKKEYLMFEEPTEFWNAWYAEFLLPNEKYPTYYYEPWTLYEVKKIYQDALESYQFMLTLKNRSEMIDFPK